MWKEIDYKEDSNDLLIPNIYYQISPAEIESVETNSIADKCAIGPEDEIICINNIGFEFF